MVTARVQVNDRIAVKQGAVWVNGTVVGESRHSVTESSFPALDATRSKFADAQKTLACIGQMILDGATDDATRDEYDAAHSRVVEARQRLAMLERVAREVEATSTEKFCELATVVLDDGEQVVITSDVDEWKPIKKGSSS